MEASTGRRRAGRGSVARDGEHVERLLKFAEEEKERKAKKAVADGHKAKGNDAYKAKKFDEAVTHYSAAIEALAARVDYPLYKLFTVDGSKRSSHSNAYMYGFFKSKRIVLFDTLLKQASDEEIVAVLAHELGHWHHGHVLLTFAISQLYVFAAFYFFAGCMGSVDIYNAFGFRAVAGASDTAGAPVIVGVLLFFAFLWEPVDHLLSFLMTWNSRRMEFQADAFGAALGKGAALQRGLVKITFENLKAVSRELGEDMTDEEISEMIEKADLDADGMISEEEFWRVLRKGW